MDELLDDITTLVAELTERRTVTSEQPYWDANRNRKARRFSTAMPSYLDMLRAALKGPLVAPESLAAEGKPGSRPPLNLDALSAMESIGNELTDWCHSYGIQRSDTFEHTIKRLTGAVLSDTHGYAGSYASQLRKWRRRCAVLTDPDERGYCPPVPCPDCSRNHSLRLSVGLREAFCSNCASSWDTIAYASLQDYVISAVKKEPSTP